MGVNQNSLESLYEDMLLIRLTEESIAERYADQEMRCPVHLSVGQEGVAVGVCGTLRKSDKVFSTHRCHAHYLAKGGNLDAMLGEIYGKETGCCGGRGGSMHLFDTDAGLELSVPIVGSSIPLSVGAALAFKQNAESSVAVPIIGDAAIEEGVFHESMNFARLYDLPVVFVCENNLFSIYTHLDQRQPVRPIEDLAKAHDVPAVTADGNDVENVLQITSEAVERARDGGGPSFLVFETYRWREHCGPNYDNAIGYRTENEFEEWKRRCPIELARERLLDSGVMDDMANSALIDRLQVQIDASFESAINAPLPVPENAPLYVYA
ncbi:MAG TPA: acetoin dehydrogenase [Rhodospirillaceae bacterium]|nr:acetoin dehydrogenase [Rhodospirillaceae bacterium]